MSNWVSEVGSALRGAAWRGVASRVAGTCALIALAGCAAEGGNALSPDDANDRVATLVIQPTSVTVYAGDTVQLAADARDGAGRAVEGASVTWSSSNEALASVAPGGRLVGTGHGVVTVTATAGIARASADLSVRLTAESRRFAYAWVHDPSTSTSYAPTSAYQHNETGGGIRIAHLSTGSYVVSFERMAKVDSTFRETVLVTPNGSAGERCNLNGWGNNANGRDLDVSVSCYTFAGANADVRFSVLVVGSHSLPSHLGFTVSGDAAAHYAPEPGNTYSSFDGNVGISRSTAGSYLVQLNGQADPTPQSYFVSTYGGASDLCKVSSWNGDVWASVICYAPSGALADARFSLLMLENGRAGKRFGFAWSNEPATTLGGSYTPSVEHQHTSSGQPVRITHSAVGTYVVSFPGLAKVGNAPETVHVSPYGGGLFTCQVQGWVNGGNGASLDATVRCWNRGDGTPADTYFTILVLE